ncbi:glucokinase [Mycetocola sp. BIGb0189]|uniref:ROK family protein n=1 Tax=Mycetocola sp. BIGb0189 TaxID=2940604 RepID=UPI0021695BC3|nr:ROK family protein [Mycetocola sp. BIGb0189]MCS4275221.1 glucokinase [Mycetocola sp. BIGb0189]
MSTPAAARLAATPEQIALAIDIGGTTIKGAALTRSGEVCAEFTVPTREQQRGPLDGVRLVLTELQRRLGEHGREAHRVGLASPGLIDTPTGTVGYSANLGWRDLALTDIIAAEFDLPAVLLHDARAGAVAERSALAAAGESDASLAFVPIGTGIAAALVDGGRFVAGGAGGAGEFGHIVVVPGGEACPCGLAGCVEIYASAANIVRRYRERGGVASGADQVAARIPTDPRAAEVWSDAVDALARGLAALTAILDPARIVIGGGLGLAGDTLLIPLRARTRTLLPWRPVPPIGASATGARAGLVGAGVAAWGEEGPDAGFVAAAIRHLEAASRAHGEHDQRAS